MEPEDGEVRPPLPDDRGDFIAGLVQLVRLAAAGATVGELADLGASAAASLIGAPGALVVELRGDRLELLAARGWEESITAALIDPVEPVAGVRVATTEPGPNGSGVGIAGVETDSVLAVPITVRGRLWALLAIYEAAKPAGVDRARPAPAPASIDGALEIIAHVMGSAEEAHRAREDLQHVLHHDQVTGLANRSLLVERAEQALGEGRRLLGAVCIDIDGFSAINAAFGYREGDRILTELGARLRRTARGTDFVARDGADRYVVLCEQMSGESALFDEAEKLRRSVTGTVRVGERDVVIRASAGVSMAGVGTTTDELLEKADMAMHVAKDQGRGRVVAFDAPVHSVRLARFELEGDLRRAPVRASFSCTTNLWSTSRAAR